MCGQASRYEKKTRECRKQEAPHARIAEALGEVCETLVETEPEQEQRNGSDDRPQQSQHDNGDS